MVRVTLAMGCRLPGHPVRPAGFTMDVTNEVFAEFGPRGFFVGETEDEPAPPPATEPVDDELTDDEPADEVKRPAKTAPVDTWRKYAESQGTPTKGLSKQEIIAATQ
ncbi:hypothetical protein [Corynebacterium striatum]|uniref:hypothetical protein n=1 Tax=Corynebacterium striatum TaxID=43770 RepID=UPI0034D5808F